MRVSGASVTDDPRDLDLGVPLADLAALVADPRLSLTTSQPVVELGADVEIEQGGPMRPPHRGDHVAFASATAGTGALISVGAVDRRLDVRSLGMGRQGRARSTSLSRTELHSGQCGEPPLSARTSGGLTHVADHPDRGHERAAQPSRVHQQFLAGKLTAHVVARDLTLPCT